MRLINKGPVPKYSSLVKSSLAPGKVSRDLSLFTDAFEKLSNEVKGFSIILSDKDLEVLISMCKTMLMPALEQRPGYDDAAVEQLVKTLKDPDGTKVIEQRAKDRRVAIQQARDKAIKERLEREARIQAESNYLDNDGNPIPKVEVKAMEAGDVTPELHPEMHNDLKSVIENNLAIITSASGKPIRSKHDVVANPGGTPVPLDPKEYQKPRTVPPGTPEYFK